MAYDVGAAFRRIEDELISSMIRNLDNHRAQETAEGFQWPQWQVEQLKALAEYKSRNKKLFNGKFGKINENISSAIREAHSRGQMEQEEKILNAIKRGYKSRAGSFNGSINTTGEFFKVNERKLNALINATTDDMKKAESAVLRMADDKYRKIIFDAQVYANAGGTTYEKAVDMATHDFLQAGLNCIEYKNGARHTISDYADMAIKTANKRAYLRGEAVKREEWGIHTVIVNKRGNPCPLCLPFVGQVLIDDVYGTGSKKDGDYTLLSEAMAEGFLHPRCQDAYATYFEGISTPPEEETPTREEAKEIEENNRQNQKKQYAEKQAEKLSRLSKYSLDSDNKRMYAARAEQWQKKAESIEKSVEKTGESGIIKSRDISGALNPYSEAAKRHAEQYYESVRQMKTDTKRIANNTNISINKIEKIKDHIFFAEHDLLDGKRRFDPSYDMAQSWQRLVNGKYQEKDVILLKHEYAELRYMEKGYTQNEAHIRASKRYNYAKYCE